MWYSLEALAEALLMSTHNICFHGEIRKILCGYPLLSGAMLHALFCSAMKFFSVSGAYSAEGGDYMQISGSVTPSQGRHEGHESPT